MLEQIIIFGIEAVYLKGGKHLFFEKLEREKINELSEIVFAGKKNTIYGEIKSIDLSGVFTFNLNDD